MSTRARLQNANDSKSLWNYTLSPGWSAFDAHILRLAVMRYGCGAWKDIIRHFPLKTCGQLNLQTQRLFGQQALAEFNRVHIDPQRIAVLNAKIDGFRKNSCLINTGNNLTQKQKEQRRKENEKKFGIPKELYEQIQVPVVLDPPTPCKTVIDQIEKLREMYRAVYDMQLRLKHLRENNGNNAANIAVKAKQQKSKSKNQTKPKNKSKNKKAAPQPKEDENDVQMANTDDGSNSNNKEPAPSNVDDSDVEITAVVEKSDKANAADSDVEVVKVVPAEPVVVDTETETEMEAEAEFEAGGDMDEETAMALALSASMADANINTPAVEKKAKSQKGTKAKKKSTKKSTKKKNGTNASGKKKNKSSRKRKAMDSDGDEPYVPTQPAKKRAKTTK